MDVKHIWLMETKMTKSNVFNTQVSQFELNY